MYNLCKYMDMGKKYFFTIFNINNYHTNGIELVYITGDSKKEALDI